MAVKIVSDLHSGFDGLAEACGPKDTVILLGDLINFIDYKTMTGILIDLYGLAAVEEVVVLRASRRFEEARRVMSERREADESLPARFLELVSAAYSEVFARITSETWVILGNVDHPGIVTSMLPDNFRDVDGQVLDLLGARVGFVGGGLPTPLRVAGEISEEAYDEKLFSLGPTDVLCSHMPPDIGELVFDTVVKRTEQGSKGLLRYIEEYRPQLVLFGHIHQPLVSSMHLGETLLVNAGYFRRTQRALDLGLLLGSLAS